MANEFLTSPDSSDDFTQKTLDDGLTLDLQNPESSVSALPGVESSLAKVPDIQITKDKGFLQSVKDSLTSEDTLKSLADPSYGARQAFRSAYLVSASVISGLWNTVPLIANAVGGKGTMDYMTTLDFANKADQGWIGQVSPDGKDFSQVYSEHAQGIELTGAIAGSFVAGTGALKAASWGMRGLGAGVEAAANLQNANIISKAASTITGLRDTAAKSRALQYGYSQLLQGNNATTGLLGAGVAAWNAVETGIGFAAQAAIFEAGSTLAQLTNPTYADIRSVGDFTKHIGQAAIFGGALGGIFGAVAFRGTKFTPVGETETTTLRQTANLIGKVREDIVAYRNAGLSLGPKEGPVFDQLIADGKSLGNQITTGDKVALVTDDLARDNVIFGAQLLEHYSQISPSQRGQFARLIDAWVSDATAARASAGMDLATKLVETGTGKGSNIQETLVKRLINPESGTPLPQDQISQIFGGLRAVRPVQFENGLDGIAVAGNLKGVPSEKYLFDVASKTFVKSESAAINIGDLLRNTEKSLKISDVGTVTIDGRQIMTKLNKVAFSDGTGLSPIESQLAWQSASKYLPNKQALDLGKDLNYSPFMVAAAMEKGTPIERQGLLMSLDDMKQFLYDSRVKMVEDFGKRNPTATTEMRFRYADLEAVKDVKDMPIRPNNFLERRHIEMEYNKALPLDEFHTKALNALRSKIEMEQTQVAQMTLSSMKSLINLDITQAQGDMIQNILKESLLGKDMVEYADRVGPGLFTNFRAKNFQATMEAKIMGNMVMTWDTELRKMVDSHLTQAYRELVNLPNKEAALSDLSLVHKLVTGGQRKWYFADHYNKVFPPNLLVSEDMAVLLQKGEDIVPFLDDPLNANIIKTPEVANLLNRYAGIESKFRESAINLQTIRGMNAPIHLPGQLYFPPLDTARNKYFVMVTDKSNAGAGGFFGTSFLHARDSKSLQAIVDKVKFELPNLEISTVEEIEKSKRISGQFDWAKSFSSYNIDSQLRSKQIASEYIPRRGDEILSELYGHLYSQTNKLSRGTMRNITGAYFENNEVASAALSRTLKSSHGAEKGQIADDFYAQLNRTALNLPSTSATQGPVGVFNSATRLLSDGLDTVATVARDAMTNVGRVFKGQYQSQKIDAAFAEFQKNAEQYGMDYSQMTRPIFEEATRHFSDVNATRMVQQTLNRLVATLTLAYDGANLIVNSLSLPITINSALREAIREANPLVAQQMRQWIEPGAASRAATKISAEYWQSVPKIYKLEKMMAGGKSLDQVVGEGLANPKLGLQPFLKSDAGKFYVQMVKEGLLTTTNRQLMSDVGEAVSLNFKDPKMAFANLKRANEFLAKPHSFTELFQRYASLRFADRIAEKIGMEGGDYLGMLTNFSEQSAGVFNVFQRPAIFQGPIGASYGLFKSYGLNQLQALARHVEARDWETIGSTMALQGFMFGAKSVPGAEKLNSYIRSQNKEDNRDLDVTAQTMLGVGGANLLLYGAPSMFLNMGLYSRGDMNPRSIFGFADDPTSLDSYPALSITTKTLGTMADAFTAVSNGGDLGPTLQAAIAHQSLSRPAARLAEWGLGAQTSKRNEVIQQIDPGSFMSWNTAVRFMGARPLDEAITSDWVYRENMYKREKNQALENFSRALRPEVISNGSISSEDFDRLTRKFFQEGGRAQDYRAYMLRILKSGNRNQKDSLIKYLRSSPAAAHVQQFDQFSPVENSDY